jgi:hypothetical protein
MVHFDTYIYALHFFILMPLLLYIGARGSATPAFLFHVLFGVGLVGFLYHGFKLYGVWAREKK